MIVYEAAGARRCAPASPSSPDGGSRAGCLPTAPRRRGAPFGSIRVERRFVFRRPRADASRSARPDPRPGARRSSRVPAGPVLVGPSRRRGDVRGACRAAAAEAALGRGGRSILLDPEPAALPPGARRGRGRRRCAPGGPGGPRAAFPALAAARAAGFACGRPLPVCSRAGRPRPSASRRSPRRRRGAARSSRAPLVARGGRRRRAARSSRPAPRVEPEAADDFFESDPPRRLAGAARRTCSPRFREAAAPPRPAVAAAPSRRAAESRRGNAAAAARLEERARAVGGRRAPAALLHAAVAVDRRVGPGPRARRARGQLPEGLSVRRRDRRGEAAAALLASSAMTARRDLRPPAVLRARGAATAPSSSRRTTRAASEYLDGARARGGARSPRRRQAPAFDSVYLGGGTPSLLPAEAARPAPRRASRRASRSTATPRSPSRRTRRT